MAKIRIARIGEVAPGDCKVVRAGDRELALYNVGGRLYATANECRHQGGPLGEGVLQGCHVICPWHYWKYDVTTGQQDVDPSIRVACYAVTVEGENVFVEL